MLEKKFTLREAALAELTLLWGDFWSGLLCSHPGSATGTQTIEAFHSFWQEQLQKKKKQKAKSKKHPTHILPSMQAHYSKEWREHMQQDDAPARPSLWPASADPLFLSGTGLHRLGENSAEEYWDAREKQNVQKIADQDTETDFYVMRARRTDAEEPAAANVSPQVAKCIEGLIKGAGTELVEALWPAGIIEKSAKGTAKLSVTNLNLLFQCHCVAMRGKLAERYYPRLYKNADAQDKTLCSCGTFGQRAPCQHVYYVHAHNGEVDLNALPERKKPGRPPKRAHDKTGSGGTKKDSVASKKRRRK